MNHKLYKVGLYVRLSQESKNSRSGEESSSIENQIVMLTKFVEMMPSWIETRTYIDDGVSGVNFNRRGFQNMMEDVRQGVINLVLVKDLSRFGRNYLEAGKYLEEELPMLGCRFVALSDGIDTETGESDIIPFLNAINDFYVRDVSERIKSVMVAKAKDGQKLTGAAPYGYSRNPNERTRLIIDQYAAEVVNKMFMLRAQGMGYNYIAGVLNKEGILPPRQYYFERQNRTPKADCTQAWTIRTVKLLLNNEIYLGHTVSLKRGTRSYRDSRAYKRDESEWIRVENTHQPIVDILIWDKVQQINQAAKEKVAYCNEPQQSLFSGLLICPDCNAKMGYHIKKETKKDGTIVDYSSYSCRTHYRSGSTTCSSHRISERNLKALVIAHIKEAATKITCDESAIQEALMLKLLGKYKANKAKIIKEHRRIEQQIYQLENQFEQLYEKKVDELISADTFYAFVNEAETTRELLQDRLSILNQAVHEIESKLSDINKWVGLIKENSIFNEGAKRLLESLIDKIEIGERVMINGVLSQDVQIYYKYVGVC